MVDDSDHQMVLRVFEALLGLPDRMLPAVPVATNRSLSLGEIEMIRRFNVEYRRHDELPERLYSRTAVLQTGALRRGAAAETGP